MTSSWKFYKSQLPQSIPADKFFSGELFGSGLGGGVTVTKDTEALQWKAFQTAVQTQQLEWKTFNLVSQTQQLQWQTYLSINQSTDPLQWVVYIEASQTSNPLLWNLYIQVNTDLNRKKFYQSEYLFEGRKKYYKAQLFGSDFLNNTLYWETGFPSLTFSWTSGGRTALNQQLSWKNGGSTKNTRLLRWSIGGLTSTTKQFQWGIHGVLNMAFGLEAYRFLRYRIPNNVNYGTFRTLDVTNSSGATIIGGSTIELEIDHEAMVLAGESDEYGDHLRVTYYSVDQAERELDVEVINPNTSTTKLRFKIQKGLPNGSTVSDYRLYSKVLNTTLFEETFRDKKNVYYFFARALSSNLVLVNGTFTSQSTGIQRLNDTNPASIGFNVPDDSEVEVEFRFLDDGANDSSRFIGIEWRGDGNSSRTFKLDNDNSTTNNQIENYDDGTGFAALGSPVDDIKIIPARMKVRVFGDQVQLYLNDALIDTVTDATASTGGMRIVFPAGAEAMIHGITVSRPIGLYSVDISSTTDNIRMIPSSHKVLLRDGSVQNLQCTVLRLKKQPDNSFTLEEMQTIGEWGESLPATVNQTDGSLEIHLYNTQDRTLASVMELKT